MGYVILQKLILTIDSNVRAQVLIDYLGFREKEENMEKGDIVMTDHPDSRSRNLVRSFGIVQEITKVGDVIIELADGSLIKRKFQSIAVYIQPPSNWRELLTQQQIVFSQPKNQMMTRGSYPKQQNN